MTDYAEWKSAVAADDAPAYVKTAEFSDEESAARGYMADDINGELPCNSRQETWASARYFAKHASDDKYSRIGVFVKARIMKAASVHDIVDDVEKALNPAVEVKTASDDSYGWVDGSTRRYPMFDAEGVKRACAYFEENKFNYPFTMRHAIAGRILKKAEEFGVEAPDGIRKTAGLGVARTDSVVNELVYRAEHTKDAESALALAKAAEEVASKGAGVLAGGAAEKLAELIEDTDVIEGRYKGYGRNTAAPEDFLFDVSLKEAESVVEDAIEIRGDMLSLSKLAELGCEMYDGVFGDGFSDSVKTAGKIDPKKLGEALSSRPAEDINEFSSILRAM